MIYSNKDMKLNPFMCVAGCILIITLLYSYLAEGTRSFASLLLFIPALVASYTIRKHAGLFFAGIFVVEIPLLFLDIHTQLYQTAESILFRAIFYVVAYLYIKYLYKLEARYSKELQSIKYIHESTKIKNHKFLIHDMKKNIARKSCTSINVLVIHFTNMKNLNFCWGYNQGAEALVILKTRLNLIFDESRIYQLSADDLAVYTERDHDYYTKEIVEKLFKPIEINGDLFEILGSIGVSIYPLHSNSIQRCISNAQFAAHQTNNEDNAINMFSPMIVDNEKRRVTISNKLKNAIQNNTLELHYQPQFDTNSGRIFGWEALLRWTDDDLGAISPFEIVNIAEQWNLINELSTWVVKNAVGQIEYLEKHNVFTKLSVNLSWKNLENSSFINWMIRYINKSNISPN